MKLTRKDYLQAASERAKAAVVMYQAARFVEAMYLSGVAVECLLRAFAHRSSGGFDARHDLPILLKAAQSFVVAEKRPLLSAAMMEVWARWKNNYRYVSTSRMRTELVRLGLHRRLRGDILKENARVSVNHALFIVDGGLLR